MTLILYRNNELVAERTGCAERPGYPSKCPVTLNKFFVSNDKKIALGYTGDEIDFTSDAFKMQLAIFRRVLSRLSGGGEGVSTNVHILNGFSDDSFLLMTAEVCYFLSGYKKCDRLNTYTGTLLPIAKDDWCAIGNGHFIVEYLTATKPTISNDAIFKHVARTNPLMWATPLDRISMDKLKPFKKS